MAKLPESGECLQNLFRDFITRFEVFSILVKKAGTVYIPVLRLFFVSIPLAALLGYHLNRFLSGRKPPVRMVLSLAFVSVMRLPCTYALLSFSFGYQGSNHDSDEWFWAPDFLAPFMIACGAAAFTGLLSWIRSASRKGFFMIVLIAGWSYKVISDEILALFPSHILHWRLVEVVPFLHAITLFVLMYSLYSALRPKGFALQWGIGILFCREVFTWVNSLFLLGYGAFFRLNAAGEEELLFFFTGDGVQFRLLLGVLVTVVSVLWTRRQGGSDPDPPPSDPDSVFN